MTARADRPSREMMTVRAVMDARETDARADRETAAGVTAHTGAETAMGAAARETVAVNAGMITAVMDRETAAGVTVRTGAETAMGAAARGTVAVNAVLTIVDPRGITAGATGWGDRATARREAVTDRPQAEMTAAETVMAAGAETVREPDFPGQAGATTNRLLPLSRNSQPSAA